MTQYIVHLYREMRLTFAGIEADTLEAAAAATRNRPTSDADDIEDCEGETLTALVDVAGDTEYAQSRFIDFEQEMQRKAAPALLAALQDLMANLQDLAGEFSICDEIADGDYGKAAQTAIAQAKASGIPDQGALLARTTPGDLNAPWSFRFERDGTEDVAVISDADANEILRSRHFWRPEAGDPVPLTLAAMRLIVAAPALLELAKQVVLAKDTEESVPVELYNAAARVIATLETGEA